MSTIYCPNDTGHKHEVRVMPGARKRAIGTAREAVAIYCSTRDYGDSTVGKYTDEGASRRVFVTDTVAYKVPNYECAGVDEDDPDYDEKRIAHYRKCHKRHDGYGDQNGYEFRRANRKADGTPGRHPAVSPTSAYIVDGLMLLAQPRVEVGEDAGFYGSNYDDEDYCYQHDAYDCSRCSNRSPRQFRTVQRAAEALGIGDLHERNWGVTIPRGRSGRRYGRLFDLGVA